MKLIDRFFNLEPYQLFIIMSFITIFMVVGIFLLAKLGK